MQKRVWFIVSATAAVIVAILVALHARHQTPQVEAAPGPPAAQVAAVQPGSIDQVLSLAGQFQPYQEIDIHPKVSGFIRHIYVDIGDRVHRGETLAILEVPELKAQLAGTVSEVARSRDDVVHAEREVARAKSTHVALEDEYQRLLKTSQAQPGLVAEQELDDADAKDQSSGAQVDAAEAALSAAQNALQVAQDNQDRVSAIESYTNVVAPLDGVVVWRYADTGALIQSGTNSNSQALPIVRLAQSQILRLRVPVPEDDVRYVHIGDPMQMRVDAVGRSFSGKVVRFTREVSSATRTMETEIDVPNPNLTLDPGMYADTKLQLEHVSGVPAIPQEALVLAGNQEEVYVLDKDNRVHIRNVTVGLQGSTLVQIASGLKDGERVILGGQGKYHNGEKVTPVLAPEPTSDVTQAQGSMVDLHDQQGGAQ
jgi:RND family efflux transporter MFP subunit